MYLAASKHHGKSVAIKECRKIGSTRRKKEIRQKNSKRLTEGKIKVIRSEKAYDLVFIRAIPKSESLVQQPLSYQLRPRSLIATCVSLTFSGLLMKAEKHSTLKSGPTRHYTLSAYIPKPHFNSAT